MIVDLKNQKLYVLHQISFLFDFLGSTKLLENIIMDFMWQLTQLTVSFVGHQRGPKKKHAGGNDSCPGDKRDLDAKKIFSTNQTSQ